MEHIHKAVEVAAAATNQTTFVRPVPNAVLRKVSVFTEKILSFAKWTGYLHLKGASYPATQIQALYTEIIPETLNTPVLLFDGYAPWPHNWNLVLDTRTQTLAEVIHYTISYDIVEPVVAKKVWGEQ